MHFKGEIKGAAVRFKPPTKKKDGFHILEVRLSSSDNPQEDYEPLSEMVGGRVSVSVTLEQTKL